MFHLFRLFRALSRRARYRVGYLDCVASPNPMRPTNPDEALSATRERACRGLTEMAPGARHCSGGRPVQVVASCGSGGHGRRAMPHRRSVLEELDLAGLEDVFGADHD